VSIEKEEDKNLILYPENVSRGEIQIKKKNRAHPNRKILGISKNAFRVTEALIFHLQRYIEKRVDSEAIRCEAEKIVSEDLAKRKFWAKSDTLFETSLEEIERIRHIKALLVRQKAKELVIERYFPRRVLSLGLHEVIQVLNVPSLFYYKEDGSTAIRIGRLCEYLDEAQGQASIAFAIEFVEWDEEGNPEVKKRVGKHTLVPSISIVLSNEVEKEIRDRINSFRDIIRLKSRKKDRLIERLDIEFSEDAIFALALPQIEDRYTISSIQSRGEFSAAGWRLDIFLRSIEKIQDPDMELFAVEELAKMFGVEISSDGITYSIFKRNVLLPGLKEVNKKGYFHVELVEHRMEKGRRITHISFLIRRVGGVLPEPCQNRELTQEHFIATRHYWNRKYSGRELRLLFPLPEYIEKIKEWIDRCELKGSYDSKFYDTPYDLSYGEWKSAYHIAKKAWKEVEELLTEDPEWLSRRNWQLSFEKLGVVDATGEYAVIFDQKTRLDSPESVLRYYMESKGIG
jgi:hypothetical protein